MIQVRWAPESADDLSRIFDHIRQDSADAAQRVVRDLYNRAESLGTSPRRGRAGRIEGTRELITVPLPYIIVYRVLTDAVEIAKILHGAQQ